MISWTLRVKNYLDESQRTLSTLVQEMGHSTNINFIY